jgi:purine-binding chemotaxis protein CheW
MSDMAQTVGNTDILASGDESQQQYLTFMLAGEEYGVDILRVQEIKGWDTVTQIPNTPVYIRGVINLRGTIVPIIDMRCRFGLEELEYGPTTVVIVLKVNSKDKSRIMGIVVDGVSDVYNMPDEEIKPSPDFGSAVDTRFVKGLATVNEKMVIVLDIDHMCNSNELSDIDGVVD